VRGQTTLHAPLEKVRGHVPPFPHGFTVYSCEQQQITASTIRQKKESATFIMTFIMTWKHSQHLLSTRRMHEKWHAIDRQEVESSPDQVHLLCVVR